MSADTLVTFPELQASDGTGLRALVCVAICTCDRHGSLRDTLTSLLCQSAGTGFQVIVADNGRDPAGHVVEEFRGRLDLVYERVPEPGLTAVRNRSLFLARSSGARFVACIDDDEIADRDWLRCHVEEAERFGADIQTGFVEPRYLGDPPDWIVSGGFFVVDTDIATTANLLLRVAALPDNEAEWFSPAYAVTGGEDHEFLNRLARGGARMRFARTARVIDMLPAERLTLRFILRRGLRDGVYFGLWARQEHASLVGRTAVCLRKAGAKLGYALNHLFWSPCAPWRARKAGMDLATALGIAIGLAGVRVRFYGHAVAGPQGVSP
uniref:glycosyltransferase n=1 Tax=Stappia sp. TaxID=1870903 RepID=UPI003BA978EE